MLKKGEYGEPANEYVYSLVARKVGVSCQTCNLVEGFAYPIVVFDYISSMPSSRKKSFDNCQIVDDLVKARALDALTWQDDNLQYIIGTDGRFYKIDNSEAFGFCELEERILTTQTEEIIQERLAEIENDTERILSLIEIYKKSIIEQYGAEKSNIFDEILKKIIETDFSFLSEDEQLQTVYSKETHKYFLARITAIKKAIKKSKDIA